MDSRLSYSVFFGQRPFLLAKTFHLSSNQSSSHFFRCLLSSVFLTFASERARKKMFKCNLKCFSFLKIFWWEKKKKTFPINEWAVVTQKKLIRKYDQQNVQKHKMWIRYVKLKTHFQIIFSFKGSNVYKSY
jgi:hypothetical protein